jgi:predicted transcriptional regulator
MLLAMSTPQLPIPSADQVRARLQGLSHAQVKALAEASAAPFTTLWKIRSGETADPRIETVRSIWPHLDALQAN